MRLTAILVAVLLPMAGTASAARLCRDTKGLFTPCVGERPSPDDRRGHGDKTAAPAGPGARAGPPRQRARPVHANPPLVAKTRLCRDSKGLFTPCAR